MKIMYCITSSSWGGAQLHVLELCEDQIKRGNDVIFVVGNKGPLFEKVRKIRRVKAIIMPSLLRQVSPKNDIKTIFKLRSLVKVEHPDIIHLHSSKAGVLGRLACVGLHHRTKVVFTVHGWAFTDGVPHNKQVIYRFIEKVVNNLADLFICVSQYDQNIGKRDKVLNRSTKSVVIYNGSKQPINSLVNHSVHKPLRLVMIARFSPQKNQKLLIQALSKIDPRSYQLTFVGDGETINDCKQLVDKLSLKTSIHFIGFRDNIIPYLVHNDVYILTTNYEGLPISIIEAMSYGLPVIASDVGGNDEMVLNKRDGYLIHNIDELIIALKRLIDNPELVTEMGKKAYKVYKRNFILENNINKVNDEYQKLLAKK